jgi:hypothetical protein
MQVAALEPVRPSREWPRVAERSRVSVTPTSWTPETRIGMSEWAAQGRRLGVIGRGAGWWIGDWLRYGNEKFGERYVRASKITGYGVQTLMNMVYVASRFEPERRRESLSFSHHAEVAAIDPEAQDRWLERAAQERLSVRCLREEMRHAQRARSSSKRLSAPRADELVCPECGCKLNKRERAALTAGD